jgi:hypothetical protein
MIADDIKSGSGVHNIVKHIYNETSSRSVFQFVVQTYVTHWIMKRKNIDFSQHRKIQEVIDTIKYVHQCMSAVIERHALKWLSVCEYQRILSI